MRRIINAVVCSIFLMACLRPLCAQSESSQDAQGSCRTFVQKFYDWYVPKALGQNQKSGVDLALKYRSNVFSPELLRLLQSSSAANTPGNEDGLDFDPFLYTQDPYDRYFVGRVTLHGSTCRAEVYGKGTKEEWSGKPSVIPELERKNGHWIFVNFYNGNTENNGNLLKGLSP